MANYLTLVNDAIRESGADLDSLTSSNFATTTDPLHIKFKNWVLQAYKEIQIETNALKYTQKRTTITINPRYHITQVATCTINLNNGFYLVGATTGNGIKMLSSGTFETADSGSLVTDDFVGVVDYYTDGEFPSGTLKIGELLDLYQDDLTFLQADRFRVTGWGRYNLHTMVSDLFEADEGSFLLQSLADGSAYNSYEADANNDLKPIHFIPWSTFIKVGENATNAQGRPEYITKAPDGRYDFYPRPATAYNLHFTYTQEPGTLSAYTDSPSVLTQSEYHDILSWRAVMYYADYDRKPEIWSAANKRYRFYLRRLATNAMPAMGFAPSRYVF